MVIGDGHVTAWARADRLAARMASVDSRPRTSRDLFLYVFTLICYTIFTLILDVYLLYGRRWIVVV